MITKLRDILNTYSDFELEEMDLWINSNDLVDKIIVEENSIDLLTHDMRIKIEEE